MDILSERSPNAQSPLLPPGSEDALLWQELALRYRTSLRGFFARRVGRQADVDDLIQDVFLRLMARAGGEPIAHAEQYIFQTAANVLRDRHRRDAVRAASLHDSFDEILHQAASEITPERVLIGKEQVKQVAEALKQLPERTRDVFILRAFEHRKIADIATLLKISTRAVEQHMAKALAHLAKVLER